MLTTHLEFARSSLSLAIWLPFPNRSSILHTWRQAAAAGGPAHVSPHRWPRRPTQTEGGGVDFFLLSIPACGRNGGGASRSQSSSWTYAHSRQSTPLVLTCTYRGPTRKTPRRLPKSQSRVRTREPLTFPRSQGKPLAGRNRRLVQVMGYPVAHTWSDGWGRVSRPMIQLCLWIEREREAGLTCFGFAYLFPIHRFGGNKFWDFVTGEILTR